MQPSSRLANVVPSWLQDLLCGLLFWASLVAAVLFTAAAVECSLLNDQAVELCSESFTSYPEFGSLTLYLCLGICSLPPPSSIGEISPAFSTNREEGFTTGGFLPIHAGVNIVCCLCLLWMCSRFVVNPFRHLRWVVSDPAVRLYEMAMWTNTLFMLGYLWWTLAAGEGQYALTASLTVSVMLTSACTSYLAPADLHSGDQEEPTRRRGLGSSSRSLDDDEVGLVNAEEEEADGKRQRRSLSSNVRRVMLGIAVHNFSFLLYKVIEVVARIEEARRDGNGYEYRLSVLATVVGLWPFSTTTRATCPGATCSSV